MDLAKEWALGSQKEPYAQIDVTEILVMRSRENERKNDQDVFQESTDNIYLSSFHDEENHRNG